MPLLESYVWDIQGSTWRTAHRAAKGELYKHPSKWEMGDENDVVFISKWSSLTPLVSSRFAEPGRRIDRGWNIWNARYYRIDETWNPSRDSSLYRLYRRAFVYQKGHGDIEYSPFRTWKKKKNRWCFSILYTTQALSEKKTGIYDLSLSGYIMILTCHGRWRESVDFGGFCFLRKWRRWTYYFRCIEGDRPDLAA